MAATLATAKRCGATGLVIVMALAGFGEGFVSALLAPWMAEIAGGGGAEQSRVGGT